MAYMKKNAYLTEYIRGIAYYDFLCDDEGLFPEKKYMCGICTNASEVLCGNILIANHDNEGNLIGLTKDEIEKVLDDHNFTSNETYIKFCKERRNLDFLKDQDGNSLIIGNYIGFGSVYLNPNTGVYEFMKSKNHPTLHFETDWYNSNSPEAVNFRKDYDLDMSGDYYKYIPKRKHLY